MSALTSLLARDQVVPVKKIEEAIQRQVISGGDLATVLLETGGVPENVLSAYVAATYGLASATRADAMNAPEALARALPKPLVERARCVPIAQTPEGVVVVATGPLSLELEQDVSEALGGVAVETRIVLEPRLAALLAQHYEAALPSRMRRLVDRLRDQDPGATPIVSAVGINRIDRPASSGQPRSASSYARPAGAKTTLAEGSGTTKYGVQTPTSAATPAPTSVNVVRVVPVTSAPPAAEKPAPATTNVAPAPVAEARPPEPAKRLVTSLLEGVGVLDEVTASQLVASATTRDDVLAVTFAFAKRYFEYAAIFLVHDDEAEGLDAEGAGASYEVVRASSFPLSRPSVLREVRDLLGARVSALDVTEGDVALRDSLGRGRHQPSVVVPIVIRQRVVVMIYGDRAGRDFGLADLPELLSFLPKVSEALQRIILQRKRGGGGSAAGASTPPTQSTLGGGPKAWGTAPAESEPPPQEPDKVFADPATPVDTRTEAEPEVAAPPQEAGPSSVVMRGAVRVTGVSIPGVSSARAETRSTSSERPSGFDLLGVPRKAPPPPSVDERAPEAVEPEATEPELGALDEDEGPELEVSEVVEHAPRADRVDTAYHISAASEEVVVLRRPQQRASRAPTAPVDHAQTDHPPRERRHDPRREDDADGIPPEVLRPQRAPAVVDEASIITDEGTSVDAIVERLCASTPETADDAIAELLAVGEVAATVVARRFPGPLWIERKDIGAKLPRGRDVSPLARALLAFKDKAAGRLVGLLEHRDGNVRFYASIVAGELAHRDLVLPLGRRLFEADAGTQKASLESLRNMRRFMREFADVLDAVRAVAGNDRADTDRRVIALRVLGELRDDRAVPLLVELLTEGDAGLVAQAHAALVVITRQDFGRMAQSWRPWLEQNAAKHRIEWLMDALLHNDEEVRRAASEELKTITQEYFGFHPSLPKRERELAHKKYRQWWEQHGAQRFSLLPA